MSDQLHEPDEQGNIVDQTEADLTAGPAATGPGGAALIGEDVPPPGHPATPSTAGSDGEYLSRGGAAPAGPESSTMGTGSGTGVDPDPPEQVPPTAPG